jgi:hypothetical protein
VNNLLSSNCNTEKFLNIYKENYLKAVFIDAITTAFFVGFSNPYKFITTINTVSVSNIVKDIANECYEQPYFSAVIGGTLRAAMQGSNTFFGASKSLLYTITSIYGPKSSSNNINAQIYLNAQYTLIGTTIEAIEIVIKNILSEKPLFSWFDKTSDALTGSIIYTLASSFIHEPLTSYFSPAKLNKDIIIMSKDKSFTTTSNFSITLQEGNCFYSNLCNSTPSNDWDIHNIYQEHNFNLSINLETEIATKPHTAIQLVDMESSLTIFITSCSNYKFAYSNMPLFYHDILI